MQDGFFKAILPEDGSRFEVWGSDGLEALDGIDILRNNDTLKNRRPTET